MGDALRRFGRVWICSEPGKDGGRTHSFIVQYLLAASVLLLTCLLPHGLTLLLILRAAVKLRTPILNLLPRGLTLLLPYLGLRLLLTSVAPSIFAAALALSVRRSTASISATVLAAVSTTLTLAKQIALDAESSDEA